MTAYYNENDPYAAEWLRNLIREGVIAFGIVDERSIVDVTPNDVKHFTQVHLFAGLGGWSFAARLAGWPDRRPLWTASCPCQPFSQAGQRKGIDDKRHLWPEARRLVAVCRPDVVAGEQVASKDGRLWLTGVRSDMEALGHAFWAADLCAAGVAAPHIRQRLWWLAESDSGQRDRLADGQGRFADGPATGRQQGDSELECRGETGRLEHAPSDGWQQRRTEPGGRGIVGGRRDVPWDFFDIVHCTDGKARRFEPGSFPLAHGVSNRVGRLRAYGNAINSYLAAEVLGAYLDGP